MRTKEALNPEDVFGDLTRKIIWTDDPILMTDEIITITNSNCELEFDSISGKFNTNLIYAFVVDLELLEVDLSKYEPSKSNNGGGYAYAECKVKRIIEQGY